MLYFSSYHFKDSTVSLLDDRNEELTLSLSFFFSLNFAVAF